MPDFFVPYINEDDYPAFRSILGFQIPRAREDWLEIQFRSIDAIYHVGCSVAKVVVSPREFAEHLREKNAPPDLHELDNFVFEKATRTSCWEPYESLPQFWTPAT